MHKTITDIEDHITNSDYNDFYQSFKGSLQKLITSITKCVDADFTCHGFEHSKRIIKQINHLLGQAVANLTCEECFCLAVAAYTHDIIMTFSSASKTQSDIRSTHAQDASTFVERELTKHTQSFTGQGHISQPQISAIAKIIAAHSNGNKENSLKDIITKYPSVSGDQQIRIPILASLLRLADELDCSKDRVTSFTFHEIKDDSLTHWKQCLLVKYINIITRTTITIVGDLEDSDKSELNETIASINKTKKKITDTLDMVNTLCFNTQEHDTFPWKFNTVEFDQDTNAIIKEQNDLLYKAPAQALSTPSSPEDKSEPSVEKDCSTHSSALNPFLIETEAEIKDIVFKNNYYHDGHFEITEDLHIRSWIDTVAMLSNLDALKIITQNLKLHLKSQTNLTPENTVFIGFGFPGLILASQLGFTCGFGTSYIPTHPENENTSEFDKKLEIHDKNIILVTDVICSGKALTKVLDHIEEMTTNSEVLFIYSVFYRDNKKDDLNLFDGKLCVLNTSFPLTICPNPPKECMLKERNLVEVMNYPL